MMAHLVAATVTALIAAAAVFLLRGRSAALRHGVLLAAVLGFAVPTPWLNEAGDKLAGCARVNPPAPPLLGLESLFRAVLPALPAPLPATMLAPQPESHIARNAVYMLWAVGFVLSAAAWLRRLLRTVPPVREANPAEVDALVHAKASLGVGRSVDLCITSSDRVPGARGWYRPCVVLPDLLSEQLSEAELHAIMAHELAHVARRDNFSAAVVRVIVSAFWFHPLLWWIERRMLAEREAACDEMVLAGGADPADYVSAILKVCRMSFTGAPGYAGATGSNLNHRMEQIMFVHAVRPSSRLLRAIPGAVLVLASVLPVSVGFLRGQVSTPAQSVSHNANDAALRKAFGCLQKGEFQEAEELFRQVYILDPDDSRGPIGLAESYVSEGRANDAAELLSAEIAKRPDQMDLRRELGTLYMRTEQYDRAIAEFQSALDTARNLSATAKAELLNRMGEANRRKGDLDEAIRLYKAAVDLDPKSTADLMLVAMILDRTGRVDQAAPVYEQILKIQPDNRIALNNLAYLEAERGFNLDRALVVAQRALEGSKNSPSGGNTAASGDAPDAPADLWDTLGWVRLKKNQPDEAAAAFRTALRSAPGDATFHYHLGLALLPLGEHDAAIQEFQTALADRPSDTVEAAIRELLPKIAP